MLNNKKILIISLISLFVIVVISGFVYSYYKSALAPKNNQINTINKPEEVLTRDHLVNNKKEEIITTDCEKINNTNLKNKCSNLAAINESMVSRDYSSCSKLSGDWRDVCLYKIVSRSVGQKIDNAKECQNIKDEITRSLCYKEAAYKLNKPELCVEDKINKDECIDNTIYYNNEEDIKGCKELKTDIFFSLCVLGSSDECNDLGSENLIQRCNAWRLLENATQKKQPNDCKKIDLENFRKVCEIYFEKNGYPDEDKDGANNYEELLYGTDPFTAEVDKIAAIQNGALKINSFVNNIYEQAAQELYDIIVRQGDLGNSTESSTSTN